MYSLSHMKLQTLFTMDYRWAYRFVKKRLTQHLDYRLSIFFGRRFWNVECEGVKIKLGFLSPYHHSIAKSLSEGKHESVVRKRWTELSKNKNVIYDIGGFSGIYGISSALANVNALVVIFEPDPLNATQIRKNIELNGLQNCKVEQVAVSSKKGFITFQADGTSGAHIAEKGITVPTITLSDYPAADLIKIDAEGEESAIVGTINFSKHPTIFLEEHNWTDHEKLWSVLESQGYQPNPINLEKDGVNHLLVYNT